MRLENLTIRRVCLHEVYKRTDDRTIVSPAYATGLLVLDERGRAAFASRVHAAFRSDAQCMEMNIRRFDAGSIAARGAGIVSANDVSFVEGSRAFADLLAEAQGSRQIPGGLVVVFDGTVGHPATRYFGVMKAELHEGFLKERDLQATFVDSLFLSPKTKLYKIGLFVASADANPGLPDGWTATVYDNQMTSAHRDGAALYFHGAYLGLEVPENNAHQVKTFFAKTRDFINASPLNQEDKVDLYNGLYTYLKVDQSPTIQVGQFADRFLPDDLRDEYREHMRRERVPDRAIQKDLSEVTGSLRLRRLRFPNKITLSGPPEAMSELVDVEAIQGDAGVAWTRITVRGSIQAQE